VPRSNAGVRAAQLNRYAASLALRVGCEASWSC
jgi:hypothetical protein